MKLKYLLLLLIPFVLFGQDLKPTVRVNAINLGKSVKDTIDYRARQVAADTAAQLRSEGIGGGLSIDSVKSIVNDSMQVERSRVGTAIQDSIDNYSQLLFQSGCDSSMVTTSDTIPLSYYRGTYTITYVYITTYGKSAPNHTLQIYHSSGTALWSSPRTINNLGAYVYQTYSDATGVQGTIYIVFPSITTIPEDYKILISVWGIRK